MSGSKRHEDDQVIEIPPIGGAQAIEPDFIAHTRLVDKVLARSKVARVEPMNAKRRARKLARMARALELEATGLSRARIGVRMAHEEGHPDEPFHESTVRDWLKEAKKG